MVDRAVGCLLGGALGDALGAPVEFVPLDGIRREYGPNGIVEPPRPALVSDDTQMTLFTAEGYLNAWVRGHAEGVWEPDQAVWRAYRRWLATQQLDGPPQGAAGLLSEERLYASRSPGLTCLRALSADEPPSRECPRNDAKGCGGVVRAAPAGFAPSSAIAYDLGCRFAALTHGHPAGWAPAGALALLVHLVAVKRRPLGEAVDQVIGRVLRDDAATGSALLNAVRLAEHGDPGPDRVQEIGQGWLGSEALAIGVYAALAGRRPRRFADALRLAANHSGDSDSTASITGQILGALHGTAALPGAWLERLELCDVLTEVATDLGLSTVDVNFDHRRYARQPVV
ncbi:putative ADP-ribosylglycohydrolase [Gandjariella thermophila]|uniref:Putative ADP-ribosylglycohydrolase n=1 Tax=Gandjariella thermophila TaxID=1931992 RepID=A0A4D4J8S4_9PSEU|nr:putative ADP-ribosylglycohydrolase [Gandjariella thermophila]